MTIAGVDGTKGGWLAAIRSGPEIVLSFHRSFEEVLQRPGLELILVDVPIGLPDRGSRGADLVARQLLQARRSSVFPAPIRPMLAASSWEEACEIRCAIEGKRCSKQTFAIMDKIAEVDGLLTPSEQDRVAEAHPEVSFTRANGMTPMQERKTSSGGRGQRIGLLEASFPGVRALIASQPRGVWLDCTDALICLWTAERLRDGRAMRLPSGVEERDSRGLRMEIIA